MTDPKFRKHIRLEGFDYSSANYYFVTVCTKNREKLFVPFVDPQYGHQISDSVAAGLVPADSEERPVSELRTEAVVKELGNISSRCDGQVSVDFYVVMPNHIHLILAVSEGDHKGRSYTLGSIIGAFKSLTTRELWKLGIRGRAFQVNYYEHIIRSEFCLQKIREYILRNPYVEYDEIDWQSLDSLI